MITLSEALQDDQLFGPHFQPADSWRRWRIILKAAFGEPLDRNEHRLFRVLAGGREPPSSQVRELWIIAGRRGGKSRIGALIAAYLASFFDYAGLAPGERAVVLVLATDKAQARVVFAYIKALFTGTPMLAALVERTTKNEIDLAGRVSLVVSTSGYRTVRGPTVAAVVADEIAFWRSEESANPDVETFRALQPGLATISHSMFVGISTGYARRGLLYKKFKDHYAEDGDRVLVIRAPSRWLNPSLPREVVEEALRDDPAAARAEWLGEFRQDVESFLTVEAIEAVTIPGRLELPVVDGTRYFGFTDPSGGARDAFTLAISHWDNDNQMAVLDCLRERKPPFSPDDVTAEFAETLKAYGLRTVTGDRYAGEWPRERFREYGIEYIPAAKPKSDLYRDLLPAINSGSVELLDNRVLATQLALLERRTSRAGKDSIDHPPAAFDDLANAAAGALAEAALSKTNSQISAEILGAINERLTRPSHFRGFDQ